MDTQFKESTNQNSIKSTKLLSQRTKKSYYETLGTSLINVFMSLPRKTVNSNTLIVNIFVTSGSGLVVG